MAADLYILRQGQPAKVSSLEVAGLAVAVANGALQVPVNLNPETITASQAIASKTGRLVLLNHATVAIAATLAAPTPGDWLIIMASGVSAQDHTVTTPVGVTWDGTNRIATFADDGDMLLVVAESATRWRVVVNVGSVAFS